MKIFLDVGAHIGETARVVINHSNNFDKIYCFEPLSHFCDQIRTNIKDDRVIVNEFGLWKENTKKILFCTNRNSASIFNDRFKPEDPSAEIDLLRASDWLKKNINPDDEVFMKLNCEGSECDIIEDIIDSGEDHKIKALMVDFDVRKIPSQKHREAETREKLKTSKIPAVIIIEDEDRHQFYRRHTNWTNYWIDKASDLIKNKKNG